MTHTPGPWTFWENSREVCAGGKSIARIAPGTFCGGRNATVDEQNANARLIVAAPELLAAIENIVKCWESGDLAAAVRLGAEAAGKARASLPR
jgi:hypothetical protein